MDFQGQPLLRMNNGLMIPQLGFGVYLIKDLSEAEKACLDDYPELAYGYTLEPYLNDTWDGLFPPTPGDIIAMAAYKYGVCKGFRDLKAEIERGMRETNGALS